MTQKTKGLLSVSVPVLVWGISFVSTEFLLAALGPMTIGAIRFVVATAMLYLMMRRTGTSLKVAKEDKGLFWLAGGVGIGLYFYFENTGIYYISAAPAALIIAAIPMFTLVFEALIYGRKIDAVDVGAILLSIVGVMLVMNIRMGALFSKDELMGYAMMLGAVIAWVVYSMASRPLFKKYSYLTIIYYQFLYSLPFFLVAVPFEKNQWALVGTEALLHLVFLSVFASVLGFYYYAKAMDLLGVTESSIFINFLPLVTIVFGYFYLGSRIAPVQWLGGGLVILSLTITNLREKKLAKKLALEET